MQLRADADGTARAIWFERGRGPATLPSMNKRSPFRYFRTSPEIIRLAVMMYIRFPLSLRNVEDLLHERGIEVSHETVADVRCRDPAQACERDADFPLALAPRRGVREDQWRPALPLAGRRSRRRGARGLCHEDQR